MGACGSLIPGNSRGHVNDLLLQFLARRHEAVQGTTQLGHVRCFVEIDLEGPEVGVEGHDPLHEILHRTPLL